MDSSKMTSYSYKVGQTLCKCKKSKCLKLYCDCFAAGLYCDENCSCQECFNRPNYDDTVVEARQLIELRNPLAFSSKLDYMEDENGMTKIMGQCMKGCNCKKSMCSKKYCECYKANVGCGSECRCEGCKNVYGIRKGYNLYNTIHVTVKTEVESIGQVPSPLEFHNPHNLTPCTSFQHSREGTSTNGRYITSPGSINCNRMIKPSKENFDMVYFSQQSYPNAEFMSQLTPPENTCINARHLTYVTDHSAMLNSSNDSGNYLSASSLSWRGSPVTLISLSGSPEVNYLNQEPNTENDFCIQYPYTGGVTDFWS